MIQINRILCNKYCWSENWTWIKLIWCLKGRNSAYFKMQLQQKRKTKEERRNFPAKDKRNQPSQIFMTTPEGRNWSEIFHYRLPDSVSSRISPHTSRRNRHPPPPPMRRVTQQSTWTVPVISAFQRSGRERFPGELAFPGLCFIRAHTTIPRSELLIKKVLRRWTPCTRRPGKYKASLRIAG